MEFSSNSKSLCPNSDFCVIYGLVLINWFFFSLTDGSFLILCVRGSFWLDVKHFKFYLVGYWTILYFRNILELYFSAPLTYLLTVWSFQVLLLRFLIWEQGYVWSEANIPLLRQHPFEYCDQCPVNLELFPSDLWEEALFLALCACWGPFSLILSCGFFPGLT